MGWLLVGVVALAAVVAGCSPSRVIYPGDGRLVIVDIDPALDACPLRRDNGTVTTFGAAVRAGLQYWNAVGVRLRTPNELLLSEADEAKKAPRLRVFGDPEIAGRDWDKNDGTQRIAQYNYAGTVQLFTRFWTVTQIDDRYWMEITSTIAHEFGHAIGLEHVSEKEAVMYYEALPENARDDLADADMREHARVWPGGADGIDGFGR